MEMEEHAMCQIRGVAQTAAQLTEGLRYAVQYLKDGDPSKLSPKDRYRTALAVANLSANLAEAGNWAGPLAQAFPAPKYASAEDFVAAHQIDRTPKAKLLALLKDEFGIELDADEKADTLHIAANKALEAFFAEITRS